jgi:hypothetical protein
MIMIMKMRVMVSKGDLQVIMGSEPEMEHGF